MLLSVIARILGAITSIYMLLCTVRVIMTWIPGVELGKAGGYIAAVTDPFLGMFSRIAVLRTERFDFSPIAALAVLSVANRLFSTVAVTGRATLGLLAALLLGAAWSAVAFVLSFLAVCMLARIVVVAAKLNSIHPIWAVLDSFLNPVLHAINRLIYRGKAVQYLQGLITGFLVLVLLRAAGGALFGLAGSLLRSLPF